MSKWMLLTVAMALAVGTWGAIASDRPSRDQVAAALNLRAGSHVPVVVDGTPYEAHFVRVELRREGEYALVFRLKK